MKRVAALIAAGVAVLGAAGTIALVVVNASTIKSPDAADPISIVMPLTFAVVGALVAIRQPRNATGWLFLVIAVVEGLDGIADQYARLGLVTHPGSVPGPRWGLWFFNATFGVVWPAGAAAALLMVMPNGHLPSRRWLPLAVVNVVVSAFVVIFLALLAPITVTVTGTAGPALRNPTGVAAFAVFQQAGMVFFIGLGIVVAAATAPFIRLRRARGDERLQLKWIAYAVLVTAVATAGVSVAGVFATSAAATELNIASTVVIAIGFGAALPVAAGVAILRYRLFDIDVVISRTLVYGSLAALITAVYIGIAVGFGTLAGSGGKPNLALSIVATAIVAIGFQPARERLQRLANRLVYGTRSTPYEVLSQFSSQVAETFAADEVLPRMARVLQEGTGAEAATVWLRGGGELRPAATEPAGVVAYEPVSMRDGALPDLPGATRAIAVRHQGELLGALSLVKRRGESLTPMEEKLLDDLAGQAGLVLKNVGLTADLQQRLAELRASRQRLVSAQDEERRRLERNLHDGAQQHLVALKVKLGLAEMLTGREPDRARATLQELKGDADEALETLRDLARGIYPPLLAERGLVTALEAQARKATHPVTVDAGGIGRYPQDVEATVYFCVLEALQNVQKYAHATQATIRLHEDHATLRFMVEDDGCGFDVAHAARGAGLTNMTDRLDALGGRLEVSSVAGRGSVVAGTLRVEAPATPADTAVAGRA